MRKALPKVVIIVLLILIVGVPILLRPATGGQDAADGLRLVIYTPHNEQIRYEIATAFNNWRKTNGQPVVRFDWRTPGGTSDIRKGILSQYQALLGTEGGLGRGIGVDLFFGGGDYDHGEIAKGVEDSDGTMRRIVMDPQIQPELFATVFPRDEIGGQPLYGKRTFTEHGQKNEIVAWTGVTLSSFGIVYNNDTLKMLGVEKPSTWRDLAAPKLQGWIALADPDHSGSITKTFETILRREGWNNGWQTLRMVYANARYFATDASRVPVDVSRGDAAMGMCIDFYGRFQAGAVGDGRVGYTDPVVDGRSTTATTADPITMLRGAPSPDLSRQFIVWLLSEDAQHLWQRAKSETDDSLIRPDRFELRRQPLRADLYTSDHKADWVDRALDPYATAAPFPDGTPNYFGMVAPVTKAMAIDLHGELAAAWKAINKAKANKHPNRLEMEARFFAMPPELTLNWDDEELQADWHAIHHDTDHPRHSEVVAKLEAFSDHLGNLGDMDANRVRWRAFFQANYREVVQLGSE